MEKITVHFELNGKPRQVIVDPQSSLLDVLRDQFGLTGAKRGCDREGLCGACTVIINGSSRRSCITPVSSVEGARVETIEGLAGPDGRLHPVQQAFIDHGAVQCGFCTPSMILSAKALLDRNPDPSREEVIVALRGNLCRCTGYAQVVDAVLAAAAVLRGQSYPLPYNEARVIGKAYRRKDSYEKVTGRFKFLNDTHHEDALFVKVVRSPHYSARIRSLDYSAALAIDGVEAVFTAKDIPGMKGFSDKLWAEDDPSHIEGAVEPILAADVVRNIGEPVVMVVARDEATARAASSAVVIDYEPLEPILTAHEAAQAGAPAFHTFGNVYETYTQTNNNTHLNLPAEEVSVQTQIAMVAQAHLPLEPMCSQAYIDSDGRVVVEGPTHESFSRQKQIALMLGIPTDRVRVIVSQMGGSFGDRHYFWPVVAVALPAYLLKRRVKMVFDRKEEFLGSLKRHPVDGCVTIGATQDGRFTSLKANILGNAGPYGNTETIGRFIVECGIGPYQWGSIDYHSTFYHTNWSNGGPFRGYGMPQGNVCTEICIDALARKLQMDPLELRTINAIDRYPHTAWGQAFDEPNGFVNVLESIRPHWQTMTAETERLNQTSGPSDCVYETGFSGGWYQFGKMGKLSVSSQVGINEEGKITVYYEGYEAGIGLNTILTQIVCQELGVPLHQVACVANDTDHTIPSTTYGACRDVYWVGGATRNACQTLVDRMLSTGASVFSLQGGDWAVDANGILEQCTQKRLTFKEIREVWDEWQQPHKVTGTLTLEDKLPPRPAEFDLSGHFTSGAAAAQIVLDKVTGKVKVKKLVIAHDVGKVINPADLQGQVFGGAMLELSSTLYEEYIPGETLSLKKYPVARSSDLPQIVFLPVEVASRHGPYGAKGLGESLGYIRSAIMNAIIRATGVQMQRLPFTPARILEAVQAGTKSGA